MKYTTHDVDTNGSFLQGQIICPFSLLVTLFGEPHEGDTQVSDAFWSVLFDDGVTATVYNWKNGRNYCGGPEVEHITKWNIGGYEKAAVDNIKGIMLSGEIAA
jgi:hypothetical protein